MKRLFQSFGYAIQGVLYAIRISRNLQKHLSISAAVMILGYWLHIVATEWMIILLCMALVISAEILNTAIEYVVNWISPGYHEKAGRIKDMAAGAVLVCAIMAAVIGLIIFIPKLLSL
jgi:diacylglycerol kinase